MFDNYCLLKVIIKKFYNHNFRIMKLKTYYYNYKIIFKLLLHEKYRLYALNI